MLSCQRFTSCELHKFVTEDLPINEQFRSIRAASRSGPLHVEMPQQISQGLRPAGMPPDAASTSLPARLPLPMLFEPDTWQDEGTPEGSCFVGVEQNQGRQRKKAAGKRKKERKFADVGGGLV